MKCVVHDNSYHEPCTASTIIMVDNTLQSIFIPSSVTYFQFYVKYIFISLFFNKAFSFSPQRKEMNVRATEVGESGEMHKLLYDHV